MARSGNGFKISPNGDTNRVLLLAELTPDMRDRIVELLAQHGVTQVADLDANGARGQLGSWRLAEDAGDSDYNDVTWTQLGERDSMSGLVQSTLHVTERSEDAGGPMVHRVNVPTAPGSEVKIGRDPAWADQVLTNPQVSGKHMSLRVGASGVEIVDHRSTCGTLVNGNKLEPEKAQPLSDNSTIRIGTGVTMQFRDTHQLLRKVGASVKPPPPPPAPEPSPEPTAAEPVAEKQTPKSGEGLSNSFWLGLSVLFALAFVGLVVGYYYWKFVLPE